jgi:hypothetical protein
LGQADRDALLKCGHGDDEGDEQQKRQVNQRGHIDIVDDF